MGMAVNDGVAADWAVFLDSKATLLVNAVLNNDSRTARVRRSCLKGAAPRGGGRWPLRWGQSTETTFEQTPLAFKAVVFGNKGI